ncbi:glycosyltransferase family 2 protein [Roseateles chitosanitabidus]|jgi:succinoglycan biosynthesis protein ExoW|uniref:glycosyltransferase family 2 protein n=1 Tax=Roseateles chitosanitabidus TaxID=65048 RepID=UPI00082E4794|nr:glycosyltransferase family A protein [Roseateles chitosanitabidus]MBO9685121.1 glycosyltransferase family 2 protein [Roseateles chitosanitabidus]
MNPTAPAPRAATGTAPLIAVVIPHFQRQSGLLAKALASAFAQTIADRIHVIVVDDESPISAQSEVDAHPEFPREQLTVQRKPNGGAGSARNKALDLVPPGTTFVAFLDSDDDWRPDHLANALAVMGERFDGYFADWWSFNYPDQTNFERIGTLDKPHTQVCAAPAGYDLGVSPLEHITSDGGGVIQTSTVVYRFDRFPALRFREEFFNGQDFFFWMDLGNGGATFCFSTAVDCNNGEGINIYQGAGWGTERSLNRLRNELFVWTSLPRFYTMTDTQRRNNLRTIRNLQQDVVRDLLHRVRHGKAINFKLVRDILRFDPTFLLFAAAVPFRVLGEKLLRRSGGAPA